MLARATAVWQHITRLGGDFGKYWLGQGLSNLGSSFTLFALPLLVFHLTGSALNLAVAFAAEGAPFILFGLLIGWVARAGDPSIPGRALHPLRSADRCLGGSTESQAVDDHH